MKQATEQELIDYLVGKTIAVVGNASSIGRRGVEVDSHDVVIRFNNFKIEGLEQLVGTKTHIWCHCHHREQADTPKPRTEKFAYQWYPRPGNCIQINDSPYYVCTTEFDKAIPIKRPSTGISLLNWLYNLGFRYDCYGFDGFETKNLDGQQGWWHSKEHERAEFNRLQRNQAIEAVIPYRDELSRRDAFSFISVWSARQFDKVQIECVGRSTILNKSRLSNRGLSKVDPRNLVAFIDSDIFITDETLRKSIAVARKYRGLVLPYERCFLLNQESSKKFIKTESLGGCTGDIIKGGVGWIQILPASLALQIGGWDENFIEWGGEDEAFFKNLQAVTEHPPKRIDDTCYHLFHKSNQLRPNQKMTIEYKVPTPSTQRPKISLIIPTRGRIERFRRMYWSALANADHKHNIEFCLYLDWDDEVSIEKLAKRKLPQTKTMVGDRIKQSAMWNNAATLASGDILMQCADDAVFLTKGWDTLVIDAFAKYPDHIALVYGNDGYQGKSLATLGFIHRKWYETLNYFVPPIFNAMWSDTWLTNIARIIKRDHYIPELLIDHEHPIVGKAAWDETYQHRSKEHGDAELFDNTKQLRIDDAAKLQRVIDHTKAITI